MKLWDNEIYLFTLYDLASVGVRQAVVDGLRGVSLSETLIESLLTAND